MRKLMRQQAGREYVQIWIEQRSLERHTVVGLVMLESVPSDLVAQGVKKMVVAIMARTEQRSRFCYQFLIRGNFLGLEREIRLCIRDHVDNVKWAFSRLG